MTEALYPAIPANHECEEEANFILPSEGEVFYWDTEKYPKAECGTTKITRKCKDSGELFGCDYPVELKPWDCGRYECPVCYPRALVKGAVGQREHVWNTLLEMRKAFPQTKWFVSSVIISAPKEVNASDYEQQHYELRKAIKKLGTQNVAATYHRWRFHNKATGEVTESVPWREYKRNPDMYEKVVSVHWHCFVIGKMAKSDKFFEDTGWVYKKMKNDRGTYSLTPKDIYNIAYYALSHHAVSTTRRRHAVHYYGMLWRLTVVSKRYTKEDDICPKCGLQRIDVDWLGLETPAINLILHRKYKLRGIDYGDLDGGLDFTGIEAPVKEIDYVEID